MRRLSDEDLELAVFVTVLVLTIVFALIAPLKAWTVRQIGNVEAFVFRHFGGLHMQGYRTLAAGIGFALIGVVILIFADPQHADAAWALIINGGAMVGLRTVTRGPVGQRGFVHPALLVALLTTAALLAGCASSPVSIREGIGGGATAVKVLATASAAKYAECVNDTEPGSPAEADCTAEKNDRGRHLAKMAHAFDEAAQAVADGKQAKSCAGIRAMRETAAALRAGLEAYMPSPHLATVEVLIQSTIPECEA